MLSIIVASAKNGVIGKQGKLPWYLPAELARFKKITTGHPIIMGRKTYESIGRALPGRTNVIVSRSPGYSAEGCLVAGSLDEAVSIAMQSPGHQEMFVIGGQSLFEEALPKADKLYLTRIDAEIEGDVFFKFDKTGWQQIFSEKHQADDKNSFAFVFTEWRRKR